jgi:hypothetical protein
MIHSITQGESVMQKSHVSKMSFLLVVALLFALPGGTTSIAQGPDQLLATVTITADLILWQPQIVSSEFVLTLSGPGGFYQQQALQSGDPIVFMIEDDGNDVRPDGVYSYELVALPAEKADDGDEVERGLVPVTDVWVQSGSFSVLGGSFVLQDLVSATDRDPGGLTTQDQVILDDLIVDGSACVGMDCTNGESFGFDTIRLKENNLRIRFQDTSSSASFPTNDWQITINDSANGGGSYFAIDDVNSGRTAFKIEAGTRANALYVDDYGRVGLGTSTPSEDLHIWYGDTPTIRLHQSGSGWAPQTWDLAGNEANFFIRDVTNGSRLPFRIQPGAPSSALSIMASGNIGVGTWTPDANLDIEGVGPKLRLTDVGGTVGNGYWDIVVNNKWNRLMIQVDGGNIPVKIDDGASNNLLQLGVSASNQVDITGDLVVSGECTEADGACAPDYVFAPGYEMLTLAELEAYIAEHKHLPNVPSGAELDANGINVQDFSYSLLEKIEELTLYILQQGQTIEALEARLAALEGTQ